MFCIVYVMFFMLIHGCIRCIILLYLVYTVISIQYYILYEHVYTTAHISLTYYTPLPDARF